MCWCFNFGFSTKKKRRVPVSSEKKRADAPDEPLYARAKVVATEVTEKQRSSETHRKRISTESTSPRSSRRRTEEHRPRSQQYYDDVYQSRDSYRPSRNVQVPDMWYRSPEPGGINSSREALLNPRPHRSRHQRQRHAKRTSQTTLRGRGAKRDPPRHSKSKKNLRSEPSQGWLLFAPSTPKTPKREHQNYQPLDFSPRSLHASHHRRSPPSPSDTIIPQPRNRRRSSRQYNHDAPSSRQVRSHTPNTAIPRVADRRFAVLAATNQALEHVRREAFAQSSPPPRRDRLRRYEGVTIPANLIPFSWDCMSSSQNSTAHSARRS